VDNNRRVSDERWGGKISRERERSRLIEADELIRELFKIKRWRRAQHKRATRKSVGDGHWDSANTFADALPDNRTRDLSDVRIDREAGGYVAEVVINRGLAEKLKKETDIPALDLDRVDF
jgi:hypothetical protein